MRPITVAALAALLLPTTALAVTDTATATAFVDVQDTLSCGLQWDTNSTQTITFDVDATGSHTEDLLFSCNNNDPDSQAVSWSLVIQRPGGPVWTGEVAINYGPSGQTEADFGTPIPMNNNLLYTQFQRTNVHFRAVGATPLTVGAYSFVFTATAVAL